MTRVVCESCRGAREEFTHFHKGFYCTAEVVFHSFCKVLLAIFLHPGNKTEEVVPCSSLGTLILILVVRVSEVSPWVVKSMALFQPASVEVQPARALSDSRRQIHLPTGAGFILHYPKLF